ncbi:hypothetical protein ACFQUU_06185 [Herbaspirillum sp. GCM10030257]|uniref:TRADD-N-associated membrane domain-containing protein n=1 Tax=Herbaspirillum sp. GCM10030257 TaxID=3273393 RepID=UPI0036232199
MSQQFFVLHCCFATSFFEILDLNKNSTQSSTAARKLEKRHIKIFVALFALGVGAATIGAGIYEILHLGKPRGSFLPQGAVPVMAAVLFVVIKFLEFDDKRSSEKKIAKIEERALEHPEKPQLAWDLARAKLESYLDRNLSQVRSIYWLTLFVMACGFGFVLYGLMRAFDEPEKLAVSIVASASGVIISFIGGSFILIYRSILSQSRDYVTVLERINAVGMAVQVIENIPDDMAQLKHETTAGLAKQLLGLYATRPDTRTPSAPGSE